jgi:hypothetical protein
MLLFFWKEFLRSIGTILGSAAILCRLFYLWKVPDSGANIFYYRLFLFNGGLLSVWMVFIVFNGLVDLGLTLLYYPNLVITVLFY